MRKSYLITIMVSMLLSVIPATTFAGPWNGWVYQTPYPTSNALLAVKFVTPKKGWLAGQHGTILYTEDGGENWEYQESGTEQDLRSISFANEKAGWAVGNRGTIYHTDDGGKTWKPQHNVGMPEQNLWLPLYKVFFTSEKEGWAGGGGGVFLHTVDGGKTWNKQDIGAQANITGIFFLNSTKGWVLAGSEVYRTTDSGRTWEKAKLDIQLPRSGRVGSDFVMNMMGDPSQGRDEGDIFFLDDKRGWTVLGTWHIAHTVDGGKTWEIKDLGYMTYGLGSISFIDEKRGCAGGTSILCTEDGGKTWQERLGIKSGGRDVIEGFMVSLWGITFASQSTGWAVGVEGEILKTEDGGRSWKVKSREYNRFVYFLNAKTGWNIKNDYKHEKASIVRTDDGGDTWQVQKAFESRVDGRFFFVNSTTGWVIAQEIGHDRIGSIILNYFILNTRDGGKTWITQFKEPGGRMGDSNELLDVFFINQDTGWVTGYNGMILHTKDGGKNWKRQKSGTKLALRKVQFIDDKRGWAIGNKVIAGSATSIILHTDDGGKHWHIQWKWETDWMWLRDLFFIDKNTGWIIGDINEYSGDAILVQTTDGGKTWSEQEFREIDYTHMGFIDKYRGVILTRKGHMLITNDGGKTWRPERLPLRRSPWHISELFRK